ncbi:hypothetical protein TRIUR3_09014 [Triticum urartu]|uniref:Uncharacterized protein n=1 Tax=Triticum urartu TaxID=4572 RepID=M7YR57_TRIUA|nr:hypothetical protein TRIUR3_09014 [Triticum urartu]
MASIDVCLPEARMFDSSFPPLSVIPLIKMATVAASPLGRKRRSSTTVAGSNHKARIKVFTLKKLSEQCLQQAICDVTAAIYFHIQNLRHAVVVAIFNMSLSHICLAAGNSVVDLDSRRVTRSTVPRCEVQVVMITPGYALAPLTGTPGPAYARENPGRAVRLSCSTVPLPGAHDALRNLHRASGIGAYSASAASCRTGVIQYVVPHVPPLLRSFPILIVKHHEQQDVESVSALDYSIPDRRIMAPRKHSIQQQHLLQPREDKTDVSYIRAFTAERRSRTLPMIINPKERSTK